MVNVKWRLFDNKASRKKEMFSLRFLFPLFISMTPKEANTTKGYREGIVAVFKNKDNHVLMCQRRGGGGRSSHNTNEWQFPQGGTEEIDTDLKDTLYREVWEELGLQRNEFEILKSSSEIRPIRYDFPDGMRGKLTTNYRGQQHIWFLCQFVDGCKVQQPNLDKAVDQEFENFAWISPTEATRDVTPWKRAAYHQGLSELGLID